MRIIVLVKQVPDTDELRELVGPQFLTERQEYVVFDEIGERALETALQQKDKDSNTEVIALTMGPTPATDILRKALAMGADRGILIEDQILKGSDLKQTATVLATITKRLAPDLIITGDRSTDGMNAVLPAMIAAILDVPFLSGVTQLSMKETSVQAVQENRETEIFLDAKLPALISITSQMPDARMATLRGLLKAKRKPIDHYSLTDLELSTNCRVSLCTANVIREKAPGIVIEDDGTAAQQVVEFLTKNRYL